MTDAQKGRGNACCMILGSAPIIYYAIHSGIMYYQLKDETCDFQLNKDGELVNVTKKWRTMALLCFITSIIVAATQVLGALANCIKPDGAVGKLCGSINGCAGIAFCSNCFVIPITIFASYSKPCYEEGGPFESQYKGFKLIWILMLALSLSLLVLMVIFMVCAVALLAIFARK